MTVFQLSKKNMFPSPEYAEGNGLLAIGGDLSMERLISAYSRGIFPWYSEGDPILWWSPDPRLILFPEELRVPRSLRKFMKKDIYEVTMDRAFGEVIRSCAAIHREKDGETWIGGDMIDAYMRLHEYGYAHSVESWLDGKLVGGLYGVALGGVFFGESMFSTESNASKVAFVKLVERLVDLDFEMIDCQVMTEYLMSFGAREVSRSSFSRLLDASVTKTTMRDKWMDSSVQ